MVLVEVTKDNLRIQLGIGGCVVLKGFVCLDSRSCTFLVVRDHTFTHTRITLSPTGMGCKYVNDHGWTYTHIAYDGGK